MSAPSRSWTLRSWTLRAGLALLLLAPIVAYLIGHGFAAGSEDPASGWPLLGALLLLGFAVALPGRGSLWISVLPLCFVLPIAPQTLGVLPFAADRVLAIGLLIGILLRRSRPVVEGSRWTETLLLACLLQTLCSGLAGFFSALPHGAPRVGESLWLALRDCLLARPLIDPTRPLEAAWQRAEWLLLALFVARQVRAGAATGQRLARGAALALGLGLLLSIVEVAVGCDFRGQPLSDWLRIGIPRNHRPLLDNNSLGSALCLLLPLSLAGLIAARGAGAKLLFASGSIAGLCLLYSSRSKAAWASGALSIALVPVFAYGLAPLLARRWLVLGLGLLGALLLAVQVWPPALLEPLQRSRHGADLLRILRLDFAAEYLEQNRMAPWGSAWRLGLKAPWAGVGLGRLPARMQEVRDPTLQVDFNPTHENAHNQFLQSFAEEGLLGTCLLIGLFSAGAVLAGRRARTAGDPEQRWAFAAVGASLCGLALNSLAGHSLLETTPALLFAGVLGLGLGSPSDRPSTRPPAGLPAWRWAPLGAGLWALLPLGLERPPLESYSFGCFPWTERSDAPGDRDRLLAPEAWWYERVPPGNRLVWLVKDVRSWQFEGVLHASLSLDGQTLIPPTALGHTHSPGKSNPSTYLKADLPPGFDGTRPHLFSLVVRPRWTNTLQFETGRQLAAVRARPLGSAQTR